MTPVRLVDRGRTEGADAQWRLCTFGDDIGKPFRIAISGPVALSLSQAPYEYDTDDIAIAFVEMAFALGR